ncbi:MAG: hypothetical protein ACREYC_15080 [Gammaproteobacteria bacterium]
MKRPAFLEGVVVAFAASAAGSVLFTVLGAVLPGGLLLRFLIAGLGLCYVLYLLKRSRDRIGRITSLAAWAVLAGATGFVQPSLPAYLLVHVGALWLIRSLYFYSSLLSALGDLWLNALSVIAAVWALRQTGSMFLSIWCFFLVQALFVAIPCALQRKKHRPGEPEAEDRFQQSYRVAESALRNLTSGN